MAVHIKNRLPHTLLQKSPFEVMTNTKPNLSRLRVFGSKVYARKPGSRSTKLDDNIVQGIFLGFTATDKVVTFIDEASGTIESGTHVLFDEAHMSVAAQKAPLAAQALQRLGYSVRESWMRASDQSDHVLRNDAFMVQQLRSTAIYPSRATAESIGFDIHADHDDPIVIAPGRIGVIPTARAPVGTYLRIAPRSGLTVQKELHVLAGVVDRDYTGKIKVVLHNFGQSPQTITRGDKIAQIIVEQAQTPQVEVAKKLQSTQRNDAGFGSTDNDSRASVSSRTCSRLSSPVPPPAAAAAAAAAAVLHIHTADNALLDDTLSVQHDEVTPPGALQDVVTPDNIITPDDLSNISEDLNVAFDLPYNLDLSSQPFDAFHHRHVPLRGDHPTAGLKLAMCDVYGQLKLVSCLPSTPAARIKKWKSELRNGYLTEINGISVASLSDAHNIIAKARQAGEPTVKCTFAVFAKSGLHSPTGNAQLYLDQMNVIAKHLWDIKNDATWHDRVSDVMSELQGFPLHIQAHAAKTIKQQRKLTRRLIQKRDDFESWVASEQKQLEQYHLQRTFEPPEPRPQDANLLSLIWVYVLKDDGTTKARCVCNGSKNMRGSVTLAETYAASLEQNGSRIFWAATAMNGFISIGADASNAFAEAPAPKAPLYVRVDDQYRDWYRKKFPDKPEIPPGHVVRVHKALQGHPESPRLWARLIDKIIRQLDLKPCIHEPCLYYTKNYRGTGKTMLFLRQVDDFAISTEDRATARDAIEYINSKMSIDVKELVTIDRFNGVDVLQTKHYIKLFNATYIDKILANHEWINNDDHDGAAYSVPMKADSPFQRRLETDAPLSDDARRKLEQELGFTYRQGIGEIIYAMVTCRPDISFSVLKLSQYSAHPAKVHFDALQDIFRYLQRTRTEGIYYWRRHPRDDLPEGPLPECRFDDYDEYNVTQ